MKDNFADVKERFADVKERFAEVITRLDGIDERLRKVETGVAELRGRKLGISVARLDSDCRPQCGLRLSDFAHRINFC